MTGQRFDDDLLDDPERLTAADTSGLLRAAASAGAQVRSTATTAAEAGLDRLAGERPRALVLITRPGAAAAAAPLLVALLGSSCPVPVVAARSVPVWVGALDVVLAHTTDPGDRELAEGVDRAVRRGAHVLVTAPADGPVAAAASGRSVLLAPHVDIPPGLVLPRALAAGLLLLDTLGLLGTDPEALAGELDREAERNHPGHESFVNPAKSLALRIAEHTPLLWGTDPVATAVAGHAAGSLAAHAGVVANVAGIGEAMALSVLRRQAAAGDAEPDVFHDPYLDAGVTGWPAPVRALLLGVVPGPGAAMAAEELPGADVVSADEELEVDAADSAAPACAAAVLALRFDMAALYLGLARGVLGGPGWAGATTAQ
ncbi:MAG: hypothetical protein GEV09_07800 [Pseudonocardiaceae bacterium]|nr:hypothetical protein [Pseudonocardiaceae bacterium]